MCERAGKQRWSARPKRSRALLLAGTLLLGWQTGVSAQAPAVPPPVQAAREAAGAASDGLPARPPAIAAANLQPSPPLPSPSRPAARSGVGEAETPPRSGFPLPFPRPPQSAGDEGPPGMPERAGRPIPGSILDPGASGPGIGRSGREMFLGGALDPRSGWPFVWLDHFRPRTDRVERLWVVDTRDCPQEMGTEPWSCLKVQHFDEEGELEEFDLQGLLAQVQGRPVLIQVQGSLTTRDIALGGLLWSHSWLDYNDAVTDDVVMIAFDWPSQRVYRRDVRDVNEKGRRAYVAAYHLARFVQAFPPESRVCLMGQSYGGRVVTSALHLLGGGCLNSQDHDPEVRLPQSRPDLHVRGIILGAASDHNWLDPNKRLERALYGCEGLLNIYSTRDEALLLYPGLRRSGHRRALGRVGLKNSDFESLGPLAARYEEHDVRALLGNEHTLLDAVANPQICRWIAPYIWAPDPGPTPPTPRNAAPEDIRPNRFRLPRRGTAN